MYLAIKWHKSDEESLQLFTPRVMRWSKDIWLMDLNVCLPYWKLLAEREGCSLAELLRDLLQQAAPEEKIVAVLAEAHWQAVLLLNYLQERNLEGFIDRSSNFGSGLYRDMSWQSWWHTVLQWGEFSEQVKLRRFNLPALKRYLKQMQKAVENVGAGSPWEMQAVGSQAVRRRYGGFIKMLWEWTFPEVNHRVSEDGFPWISYKVPGATLVRRWLEEPLYEWEQVRSHLKDDLDKMCALDTFTERQKLVCLEWRLTLHNAAIMPIPIHFRHPHCLHSEANVHGTALLQANYAFEDAMRAKQKESLEETDAYAPPIVGWELVVKEQLTLPPKIMDLFGDMESDEAALLRLENRLPVKLYHFDLKTDWSPEESYAIHGQDTADQDDATRHSLTAMAKRRPLFLYQRRIPLDKERTGSSLWQFTERTMNKWWQGQGSSSAGGLAKDYYRYVDEKHRSLWVAKGEQNRWYVHGIFA